MPTPTLYERIAEAQRLLARAQADVERAVRLLVEACEPEYHELPPVAPAETPGERAVVVAHWFEQAMQADPQFRAFVLNRRDDRYRP